MKWHPISNAPVGKPVLVWWPLVALTEAGDVTDQMVDGEMLVSVQARGRWELPEASDATIIFRDQRCDYAATPSHWQPLPARPSGTEPKAID